ncbi:hypothetical protein THAOC_13134 [Thalassiosira oceanica]|uniref:Uncharacterized protein n=1 Tax=Thalassiosira oceanica TaxID=159749 RepID=K0T698_THAOC|nr:hypothetical protein THAOC_13134 [Thalassiosira oceanica]|eukprot:EJK65967.1 hypothetical protein THAOC_13134 [Thalassiosira oceanica]
MRVKTLLVTIFRFAGVEADEELLALWMLGKVRDPYIKRYTDAILQAQAQDKKTPRQKELTIVADFVARDCPPMTQASNDSGLGGRTDVFGEVKTMEPPKPHTKKATAKLTSLCRPAHQPGQAELQEAGCRSCRGRHNGQLAHSGFKISQTQRSQLISLTIAIRLPCVLGAVVKSEQTATRHRSGHSTALTAATVPPYRSLVASREGTPVQKG